MGLRLPSWQTAQRTTSGSSMPIYIFYCEKCQIDWEIRLPVDKYNEPQKCAECESSIKRIPAKTSFQLKGGGWFKDGYSKPPKSE